MPFIKWSKDFYVDEFGNILYIRKVNFKKINQHLLLIVTRFRKQSFLSLGQNQ